MGGTLPTGVKPGPDPAANGTLRAGASAGQDGPQPLLLVEVLEVAAGFTWTETTTGANLSQQRPTAAEGVMGDQADPLTLA